MSFRAEILKSGSFVNLDWIQGSAPVVSKSIETQYQIFSFQSSNVRLQVFDTKEIFRPGGSSEIVAEDEVKIYHSDVLIFHGIVDTIINWNPISGVLSFMVIGWLGQVNQLFAGRTSITTVGEDFRYRYRKIVQEDFYNNGNDIAVEYIAYPKLFEVYWASDLAKRVGYSKEWLFDSRALASSQVFDSEAFLYDDIGGVAVGSGLWRKPEERGYLYEVGFESILAELVEQFRQATLDDYTVGSVDFGTIETSFPVPIALKEDTLYIHAIYFAIDDNVFCFGFEKVDETTRWGLATGTTLFRISSKISLEYKADFAFLGQAYTFNLSGTQTKSPDEIGFDLESLKTSDSNPFFREYGVDRLRFWGLKFKLLADGRVLVYQLWSWLIIRTEWVLWGNRGREVSSISNAAHVEFFLIDPSDGRTSGIASKTLNIWNIRRLERQGDQLLWSEVYTVDEIFTRIIEGGLTLPRIFKSVRFVGDNLPARGGNWTEENGRQVLFNSSPDDQDFEITANGGQYFLSGGQHRAGVLAYQGNLEITEVAFDFNNKLIVDIMLEMAKLTNSLFYIDDSKQVHFINRAYYNTTAVRDLEAVISVTSSAKTLKGSNLPVISSQIINNPEYNKALNDYYIDTYFPESVTMYSINCLDTASNIAIVLLDKVRFDYQSVSTIGIVQSFEIREGNMKILARAA